MKRHITLMHKLLKDIEQLSGVNTAHDANYIMGRVEHEGMSFLTITLPTYAKDLERSLAQGSIDTSLFQAFRKDRRGFPTFLSGFLFRLFDPRSGDLLPDADPHCVRYLRQICYFYQRVLIPCTMERTQRAYEDYVEREKKNEEYATRTAEATSVDLTRMSRVLFGTLFNRIERDRLIDPFMRLIPKHSSGATANRLVGNAKYSNRVWTKRLDAVYNHVDAFYPHPRYYNPDECVLLDLEHELPTRIVAVPKTLKTPRIIAIEPNWMMFVQQGLLQCIKEFGHKQHEPFAWFTQCLDQTVNGLLAQEGSENGSLATLDLKEASDCVLTQHVEALLAEHPLLREFVFASRTMHAEVPGHGVIPLTKFASMGSALTFPLEAMVFTCHVFLGIERAIGRRIRRKDLSRFKGRVAVYGDDIIVPTDYAPAVIDVLHESNFVVNMSKSFWTGRFRESCGFDWYNGSDVTVVRVKTPVDDNRIPDESVEPLCELQNNLYNRGYLSSAEYLADLLSWVPRKTEDQHHITGIIDYRHQPVLRYNKNLQCLEQRCLVVKPKYRKTPMSGEDSLMKFFIERGSSSEPLAKKAYQESGRPLALTINKGWCSPNP